MSDITIPDAAREAACDAWDRGDYPLDFGEMVRVMLTAAAPHIAAQALRDLLADAPESGRPPRPFTSWREWIAARADRIEADRG